LFIGSSIWSKEEISYTKFKNPQTVPANSIPERVLICGVCKNVENRLPNTMDIIEKIGSLCEDYQIIVYENNSTDRTVEILKKWKKKNRRLHLTTENIDPSILDQSIVNMTQENTFFHPEAIARARHLVLDIAMSDKYEDFPYIIWIDMDFKIAPCFEGIVEVFQANQEWDAVFAYGVDPRNIYWDWYAFRHEEYPIGPDLLGDYWWRINKEFFLNENDPWYPVYSAFGGCGIYKKSSIVGCRYSGIVTKDLEIVAKQIIEEKCDHSQITIYRANNQALSSLTSITDPVPHLPQIKDPNVGVLLQDDDPLIWRMNFFVYQYPSVCEHVTFHASMIARGHNKLFINPRLIFTYGEY
jgi:glycosyltransferase involved in cell wall biosynthesis